MEEALARWPPDGRPDPDTALLPEGHAAPGGAVWEAAAQSALQAEQISRQSQDPRRTIRQAILVQAVLALKLEAILGRDEAARQAFRAFTSGPP